MSSSNCPVLIRTSLLDLEGVIAVEVYEEDRKAVVTYDKNAVAIEAMKVAIEKKGYEIV